MKKLYYLRYAAILFAIISLSFSSCTKKNINEGTSDTSSLQQLSKDQSEVQSASDDGLNDASNVLSPGTAKSRWVPAHATLDSTSVVGDTITYILSYNGYNVWGNRFRTGKIQIKKNISTLWSQQGAKVWITFVNFKVAKNGKSITLNGTKLFENVSGGLLINLGNGISQIIQQVTGTLQLTFDDTTQRTWNIARRRTFNGSWNQLLMNTDGFGTSTGLAGVSNLEAWGTNRKGELFFTQITQSIVHKLSPTGSWGCGFEPTAGKIVHQIPSDNKSATITFGYDDNNLPVTTTCPTKYKLDWVKNGNSGTLYLSIQ
jgi:hypothetical protein